MALKPQCFFIGDEEDLPQEKFQLPPAKDPPQEKFRLSPPACEKAGFAVGLRSADLPRPPERFKTQLQRLGELRARLREKHFADPCTSVDAIDMIDELIVSATCIGGTSNYPDLVGIIERVETLLGE